MRQVIVELDDKEMAKLEAIARELRVEPADVLKAAAIRSLTTNGTVMTGIPVSQDEAKEQRRQARLAILMRSHGIFDGDKDKPKDGLVYQKELRAGPLRSEVVEIYL